MGCASTLLLVLNCLTLLVGCFLLGISIYLRVEFTHGWETIVSLDAVYIGMAAGGALIVLSVLGCTTAQKDNKQLDCCYLVLVICVFGLTIACAVIANQYRGSMKTVADSASWQLEHKTTIQVNNGLLSMYTACCSGCTDPAVCNNVNEFYDGVILPNCLATNASTTSICEFVEACPFTAVASTPTSCYKVPLETNPKLPPVLVDTTICTTLTQMYSNDTTPIVGPAIHGSCGGGDPTAFRRDINTWFADRWYWIAIAMAVVCGVEALIILCTVVVLCSPGRHHKG